MIEIADGGCALRVHEPGELGPSALGASQLHGLLRALWLARLILPLAAILLTRGLALATSEGLLGP